MTDIVVVDGSDLEVLLALIHGMRAQGREIHKISINPRDGQVAIKINESMWSPSIGHPLGG